MKELKRFSGADRVRSFSYALNGIVNLIKREHNARIHLAAVIAVVILGVILDIAAFEWALITLAVGLVFISELLNTAAECLSDFVCLERNEKIRLIKDYAAGAVLVSAIVAVTIGMIIFVPKMVTYL